MRNYKNKWLVQWLTGGENLKTYEIEAILQIKIKTEITDDGSSTPETLRYLIEEDLKDLGYEVDSVVTVLMPDLDKSYWINNAGMKCDFDKMSKEYLGNVIRLLKRSYLKEELLDSKLFQGLTQEYMLR